MSVKFKMVYKYTGEPFKTSNIENVRRCFFQFDFFCRVCVQTVVRYMNSYQLQLLCNDFTDIENYRKLTKFVLNL